MAWVTQKFEAYDLEVDLEEDMVSFRIYGDRWLCVRPGSQSASHAWAMMLRRAARRLEEIGKGLPDGR